MEFTLPVIFAGTTRNLTFNTPVGETPINYNYYLIFKDRMATYLGRPKDQIKIYILMDSLPLIRIPLDQVDIDRLPFSRWRLEVLDDFDKGQGESNGLNWEIISSWM